MTMNLNKEQIKYLYRLSLVNNLFLEWNIWYGLKDSLLDLVDRKLIRYEHEEHKFGGLYLYITSKGADYVDNSVHWLYKLNIKNPNDTLWFISLRDIGQFLIVNSDKFAEKSQFTVSRELGHIKDIVPYL